MNERALIIIGLAAIIAIVILFTTPLDEKFAPVANVGSADNLSQ